MKEGIYTVSSQRGFSLPELLVALVIMALMAAFAVLSLPRALSKSYSEALAMSVSSELRLAHQAAIATQRPVAVCLPSAGGLSPCSQSIYIVSGRSQAHVTRSVSYAGDFPQAVLFEGIWPLAAGAVSLSPPSLGVPPAGLTISSWLSPSMQQDYCLVFLPNGTVTSNGLPYYGTGYHLVAAAGARYGGPTSLSSAPSPGPTYFPATGLGQPWTITVSQQGLVTTGKGLDNQDGSVADIAGTLAVGAMPMAPGAQALGASNPNLQTMSVLPVPPSSGILPLGANVSVSAGSYITLQVYATDNSGRDLFVSWTGSGGNFSFPAQERMQWSDAQQRWQSNWQWSPPNGAPVNSTYSLQCSLGDGINATIIPAAGQTALVPATYPIYLTGVTQGFVRINPDGSGFQQLNTLLHTTGQSPASLGPSADGTKFLADVKINGGSGPSILTLTGKNGDIINTFVAPTMALWARLSRSGNKICYALDTPPGTIVANGDNSNPVGIYPAGAEVYTPAAFSPDASQVALVNGTTGPSNTTGQLLVANSDGSGASQVPNAVPVVTGWYTGFQGYAVQSGQDGFIYYQEGLQVVRIWPDGTQKSTLPVATPSGQVAGFSLSPDGTRMVQGDANSNTLIVSDLNGGNPLQLPVPSDWWYDVRWSN